MPSSADRALSLPQDSKLAAHTTHRTSCRTLVAMTAVLIALIAGSTFWLQSPELPGATASSGNATR
jgi:hypothetical protein